MYEYLAHLLQPTGGFKVQIFSSEFIKFRGRSICPIAEENNKDKYDYFAKKKGSKACNKINML
jgi:hypothetical protein